jgi:hypothetical protein
MADSLREALTAAIAEQETTPVEAPVETPAETTEQAEQRARDEKGRFAAKDSTETAPKESLVGTQDSLTDKSGTAHARPELQSSVETRKPPSSWKKEYWDAYQKLDPQLADYIAQREQQFASGVSTYKQEAERAKELWEAITPFQEDLNRYNIQPGTWIRNLGQAHQMLAKGTPEQKISMFQKLAQDYNVPLHSVQTGQVDPITQYVSPLHEQVRQLQGQLSSWQQQQEQREQQKLQSEIQQFAVSHPHYEAVREQMAGLLQSGMAQDLEDAYTKATRLNDELWQSEQQRMQQENAEKQRQAEAARVAKAKANAVSPKGSTPVGNMGEGKKGLREQLSEAIDAQLGGRV